MKHFDLYWPVRAALLAVLWHALMPLLMNLPGSAWARMELCTSVGVQKVWVEIDPARRTAPGKDLRGACPLCLVGAYFAVMPPEDRPPWPIFEVLFFAPEFSRLLQNGDVFWPAYLSRAPPLV